MEGMDVVDTTLEITLEEFIDYIKAYKRDGNAKVKVMDGYADVDSVTLNPPTIIGTDDENNRISRIRFIDKEVVAIVIIC